MAAPVGRAALCAVVGVASRSPHGAAFASRKEAVFTLCALQQLNGDVQAYRHSSSCTASDVGSRASGFATAQVQPRGFSTSAAPCSPATAVPSFGQPAGRPVRVLQPELSVPAEARAPLADELDAESGRGRRTRKPLETAKGGADAALSGASGQELDDAEVQVVLNKLVGGLTKSGRKSLARRIVLDAFRIMRQHLRKGNLEDLK